MSLLRMLRAVDERMTGTAVQQDGGIGLWRTNEENRHDG